jgi:hypothetical protein
VGPIADLDAVKRKILPCWESNPSRPARCYTDSCIRGIQLSNTPLTKEVGSSSNASDLYLGGDKTNLRQDTNYLVFSFLSSAVPLG